ncbi:MAG: single-stranded DNA-binding protein [Candidatus Wolfebacteria bacterium]|nr:single-stranded DNA-binding protein [Candidatus Wolfebacteria bacterium]
MNLNKVFIVGNLTRDPELRTLPSGMAVTSFGVATNRVWKNQKGEKQDDVQFHNVVVFGRQAEIVSQYLTKGSLVLVEGRIQTRSWDDKSGVKQYRTEIVAERIQFGPRSSGGGGGGGRQDVGSQPAPGRPQQTNQNLPEINIDEEQITPEDLPF